MDKLIERLPEIISAAAQSYLGILALLSVALAVLAYFFFAKASEKVKVGIFVLLFIGVFGFAGAIFRASTEASISPRTVASIAALSKETKILLKEAALDPSGLMLFERFGASVDLHAADGVSLFTNKADHRALAAWESALQELVKNDLLAARGGHGEVFESANIAMLFPDAVERTFLLSSGDSVDMVAPNSRCLKCMSQTYMPVV
ncbi:MAG: hypothetical protein ACU84H_02125 [Gammaproteobacteria bacterium]